MTGFDRRLDTWMKDSEFRAEYERMRRELAQVNKRRRRKYWYMIHIDYCVLCGREWIDRERRYTNRPSKWEDRHKLTEMACSGHFL